MAFSTLPHPPHRKAGDTGGSTPKSTYTSAAGVPTTVLASDASYSVPVIAISIGLLAMLLTPKIRAEFRKTRKITGQGTMPDIGRGWRAGHRGRDRMHYEEWCDGAWQRIDIDGEMLTGRAHHVIYFASPERWRSYPEWARHRRAEIIGRIQSEFREPDYEYDGDALPTPARQTEQSAPAPAAEAPPASPARHHTRVSPVDKSPGWRQWAATLLVVAVLVGRAAGMIWLVTSGLGKGETVLPSKHTSQRRSVSREQEPVQFWACIGIYTAVGCGAFGPAGWGFRASWQPGRSDRS